MYKSNIRKIVIVALAVVVNIVGSKISILLSLPIFLDSIGTIMSGTILGPGYGLLTALVGGLVNGALGDIYSIYFAPSGMLMGVMAGFMLHNRKTTLLSALWKTFIIVLPASLVSSLISTILFGGITTALVTTMAVQVLSKTVLDLFSSAFVVQLVTDYVDKLIAVVLTLTVMKRLPYDMVHFERAGMKDAESNN